MHNPGLSSNARLYMASAHAPATERAYRSDIAHFRRWLGPDVSTVTPETIGNYLADHAAALAPSTLRRRVSAILLRCHKDGAPIDPRHPSIKLVLRGIREESAFASKRAAALEIGDVLALVAAASGTKSGLRDRAMILLGFAGAFRRSELVGIDAEHVAYTQQGVSIFIPRSKEDQAGRGATVQIQHGSRPETCPVLALRAWLAVARIARGPVFRRMSIAGRIGQGRLHSDAVRRILVRLADVAKIKAPDGDRLSSHGLRAGFVTAAYRAGIGDEEIMAHTRHRDTRTMRGYVRRNRLEVPDMSKAIGL